MIQSDSGVFAYLNPNSDNLEFNLNCIFNYEDNIYSGDIKNLNAKLKECCIKPCVYVDFLQLHTV